MMIVCGFLEGVDMRYKMKKLLLILFVVAAPILAHAQNLQSQNIILLIPDGAGLTHISYDIINNPSTNFARFKTIGLVKTSSTNSIITDSAASATAYATGQKTYNGAIGIDRHARPFPSILELVKKKGFSTGVIVTSSLTHATPAAFLAHAKARELNSEIAADIIKGDVDILIGGGEQYFSSNQLASKSSKGYKIYKNSQNFFADKYDGKILALLAKDRLPKMSDGRGDYSVKALTKTLDILSKNKNGFFVMFEGSQIDWGGHNNDADYIKQEMLDFDKTVGVALDFASHHKNTLVIVVSDHETGGFALTGSRHVGSEDYGDVTPKFTSDGHSATLVPLFAYGLGAENFSGIYENSEVFNKICQVLNLNYAKEKTRN